MSSVHQIPITPRAKQGRASKWLMQTMQERLSVLEHKVYTVPTHAQPPYKRIHKLIPCFCWFLLQNHESPGLHSPTQSTTLADFSGCVPKFTHTTHTFSSLPIHLKGLLTAATFLLSSCTTAPLHHCNPRPRAGPSRCPLRVSIFTAVWS